MRPLKNTSSLFDRRPADQAMYALYKRYHEALRLYVLRAVSKGKVFYEQTGYRGEGQRYVIRDENDLFRELLDIEWIHSMTYRRNINFLTEVPLQVRLGPAGDFQLDLTRDGAKFLSKRAGLTTYESVDALNEHFRSEVNKLRGNVPEISGVVRR